MKLCAMEPYLRGHGRDALTDWLMLLLSAVTPGPAKPKAARVSVHFAAKTRLVWSDGSEDTLLDGGMLDGLIVLERTPGVAPIVWRWKVQRGDGAVAWIYDRNHVTFGPPHAGSLSDLRNLDA